MRTKQTATLCGNSPAVYCDTWAEPFDGHPERPQARNKLRRACVQLKTCKAIEELCCGLGCPSQTPNQHVKAHVAEQSQARTRQPGTHLALHPKIHDLRGKSHGESAFWTGQTHSAVMRYGRALDLQAQAVLPSMPITSNRVWDH